MLNLTNQYYELSLSSDCLFVEKSQKSNNNNHVSSHTINVGANGEGTMRGQKKFTIDQSWLIS